MKSLHDASFRNTSPLESFEKLRRELGELENCVPTEDCADGKVRLDCNGEVVDFAPIGAFVTWYPAPGMVLIEFVCPRCDRLHESIPIAKPASEMERQ